MQTSSSKKRQVVRRCLQKKARTGVRERSTKHWFREVKGVRRASSLFERHEQLVLRIEDGQEQVMKRVAGRTRESSSSKTKRKSLPLRQAASQHFYDLLLKESSSFSKLNWSRCRLAITCLRYFGLRASEAALIELKQVAKKSGIYGIGARNYHRTHAPKYTYERNITFTERSILRSIYEDAPEPYSVDVHP